MKNKHLSKIWSLKWLKTEIDNFDIYIIKQTHLKSRLYLFRSIGLYQIIIL